MSFARYPAYKNSGVEWLGEVPEHWGVGGIRHFAFMRTGHTPSRSRPEYWEDCSIPWFTLADVWQLRDERQRYLEETSAQISHLGLANSAAELLPKGTVVFSRTASVGFSGIMPRPMATSQDFWNWIPKPGLVSEYLLYLFRAMRPEFTRLTMGSTHKTIYQADASLLHICVPSEKEQMAIATFLDREAAKIDALIAEQERLIGLLAEKRQAVISQAVTKGLDPTVPMKDSGVEWLGEVPGHWEVVPLKYLVNMKSGGTPSKENLEYWDGDVPWASAKDMKSELLADTIDHISQMAVTDGVAQLVSSASVVVVVRGMILAKTFPVAILAVPMTINQDLRALAPREGLSGRFLARLLQASSAESTRRIDEAGHGTKALRMEAWTTIKLPLPSPEEQLAIVSFVEAETTKIDTLTTEARRAIDLLKERRSALISAAVTGKIDVRGLKATA